MLKEVDVNQDKTVDFGEFLYLMHRSRHEVNDDSDQEQNEAQGSFAALAYEVEAKATLVRGQFVAYLFLLLTFCFLIGSSTAVFQYFKCHEFPEAEGGTRRFLYKDYSLDCDSVRYKRYIPYALLMVLIFPIGIPGFYWVLLRKHKVVLSDEMAIAREASEDFPTIGHLLFLTEAYRAEHYYFEVTECVRRLLLASVIGMVDADSHLAPTLGLLICFVFLYVFIANRPFRGPDDSNLGIILQYSITLFFLAALLAKVNVMENQDPTEEAMYGYALTAVLLLGPFMVAAQFFGTICCRCKPKASLKQKLKAQNKQSEAFRRTSQPGQLKAAGLATLAATTLWTPPPAVNADGSSGYSTELALSATSSAENENKAAAGTAEKKSRRGTKKSASKHTSSRPVKVINM